MDLLDHKYVALVMGDGKTRFLPVALQATCADRPSASAAQAQVSQALPDSFVPTGYYLDPDGCVINPGGGDPGGGTDPNPLATNDLSGENNIIYEEAP